MGVLVEHQRGNMPTASLTQGSCTHPRALPPTPPPPQDRLDADDADSVMRGVLLNKGARHTMCAPLLAGMHMAGAGRELHQLGQVWAEHTGVALQAMDDVADLIGNFVTTGKDTFQVNNNLARPACVAELPHTQTLTQYLCLHLAGLSRPPAVPASVPAVAACPGH